VRVPAAGADRKFAVFGALDYATGQVRSQLSLRKNSQAFVGFLERLRQAWPQEKRMVVLDNVGYHKSHRKPPDISLVAALAKPDLPLFSARLYPGAEPDGAGLASCEGQTELPPLVGQLARAVDHYRSVVGALEGALSSDERSRTRNSPKLLHNHLEAV
jgi:DDE superfamily endonuclease